MNDPFITALNTQKAAVGWFQQLAENMGNIYTPGYRAKMSNFGDFINGVQMTQMEKKEEQGKSIPGRGPSNLFIEGKAFFTIRKPDGTLRFTRLGDFKFDGEGTYVNDLGWKVQGYLLGEDGNIINTGGSNPSSSSHNPNHGVGGTAQIPTTEINLWVDPTNGKFFGKYDEYKIQSDGTVVGMANSGKTVTPLYKLAIVNFISSGNLTEVEPNMYVPNAMSGEPTAGTGEIRSGLLEKSNVDLKEHVSFLQEAKLQLDVTAKLISTNKNLLEESLLLIQ